MAVLALSVEHLCYGLLCPLLHVRCDMTGVAPQQVMGASLLSLCKEASLPTFNCRVTWRSRPCLRGKCGRNKQLGNVKRWACSLLCCMSALCLVT